MIGLVAPGTLRDIMIELTSLVLIKGSLLILFSFIATTAVRSASAATRSLCSTALGAALVALPLVSAFMPQMSVRVPAMTPVREQIDASVPTGQPSLDRGRVGTRATDVRPVSADVDFGVVVVAACLLTWLVGAALLISGLVRALARVRSIRRRAAPIDLEDLAVVHGVRRRVRFAASPDVQVPVTGGLVRPFVILPDAWCDWEQDRLRAVLVHELSHVARWDFATHLLFEAVRAFYWPNPLVWRAMSKAATERELAADDRVIMAGVSPAAYATELLAFAATSLRPTAARAVIGIAATGLKRRVRAVLSDSVNRDLPTRWRASAVASTTVLGLVAVGPLSVTRAEAVPRLASARAAAAPPRPTHAPNPRDQNSAALSLGDARKDSLLTTLLFDDVREQRLTAARALRSSDARDHLPGVLVSAFSDSCYGQRYRAARALRELRDERAVPGLVRQLLADRHPAVRAMVANAIAASGVSEGATLLRSSLVGAPGSSFDRVGRAIDTLGNTAAHDRLLNALRAARRRSPAASGA